MNYPNAESCRAHSIYISPFETRREKKLHWPQTCQQNAPQNTYIRCAGKWKIPNLRKRRRRKRHKRHDFISHIFLPPPFFAPKYRAYFTFRELKGWGKEGGKCIAEGKGEKKSPDSFFPPTCFMEFSTVFFARNGRPCTKKVNLFFPLPNSLLHIESSPLHSSSLALSPGLLKPQAY